MVIYCAGKGVRFYLLIKAAFSAPSKKIISTIAGLFLTRLLFCSINSHASYIIQHVRRTASHFQILKFSNPQINPIRPKTLPLQPHVSAAAISYQF
jgi:hypothetical protein